MFSRLMKMLSLLLVNHNNARIMKRVNWKEGTELYDYAKASGNFLQIPSNHCDASVFFTTRHSHREDETTVCHIRYKYSLQVSARAITQIRPIVSEGPKRIKYSTVRTEWMINNHKSYRSQCSPVPKQSKPTWPQQTEKTGGGFGEADGGAGRISSGRTDPSVCLFVQCVCCCARPRVVRQNSHVCSKKEFFPRSRFDQFLYWVEWFLQSKSNKVTA